MPPALSDEESVGSPTRQKEPVDDVPQDDEEEEDIDSHEGEEVYVVEKICAHAFEEDGTVKYEVKWEGYDKKADRTWEPEENLDSARDALEEYFEKIGGRPKMPSPSSSGKRRKISQGAAVPTSSIGTGRGRKKMKPEDESERSTPVSKRKETQWVPPKGTWENDVVDVDTIEEVPDPKTGKMDRYAYIVWDNGRKTQHPLTVVNQKCPQKMLSYYEKHLVFRANDDE